VKKDGSLKFDLDGKLRGLSDVKLDFPDLEKLNLVDLDPTKIKYKKTKISRREYEF
jgi:hypothetical protein